MMVGCEEVERQRRRYAMKNLKKEKKGRKNVQ